MGAGNSKADFPDYTLDIQLTESIPVEDVIATAEAAGRAILEVYNSEASKWEVETKSDNSPLTRADREANAIICRELAKLTPHIPIITEENQMVSYDVRKKFQYFWLVDPLDGTKEFLKRNGQFTVNIALIRRDTPVMGVVSVPCLGKTYWAVSGKGAWLRTPKSETRIQCAEFGFEDAGLKVVASGSHMNKETEELVNMFDTPNFLQVGSSLKLLMVAEGEAHLYPRLGPTCEWDTAAADVIVREAGGVVLQAGECDEQGKALQDWKEVILKETPLVYNKPKTLNPFFVVFGKRRGADAGLLPSLLGGK